MRAGSVWYYNSTINLAQCERRRRGGREVIGVSSSGSTTETSQRERGWRRGEEKEGGRERGKDMRNGEKWCTYPLAQMHKCSNMMNKPLVIYSELTSLLKWHEFYINSLKMKLCIKKTLTTRKEWMKARQKDQICNNWLSLLNNESVEGLI